jgi:hypothetical protein
MEAVTSGMNVREIVKRQMDCTYVRRLVNNWNLHYDPIIMACLSETIPMVRYDTSGRSMKDENEIIDNLKKKDIEIQDLKVRLREIQNIANSLQSMVNAQHLYVPPVKEIQRARRETMILNSSTQTTKLTSDFGTNTEIIPAPLDLAEVFKTYVEPSTTENSTNTNVFQTREVCVGVENLACVDFACNTDVFCTSDAAVSTEETSKCTSDHKTIDSSVNTVETENVNIVTFSDATTETENEIVVEIPVTKDVVNASQFTQTHVCTADATMITENEIILETASPKDIVNVSEITKVSESMVTNLVETGVAESVVGVTEFTRARVCTCDAMTNTENEIVLGTAVSKDVVSVSQFTQTHACTAYATVSVYNCVSHMPRKILGV